VEMLEFGCSKEEILPGFVPGRVEAKKEQLF
jgi:hypothetical protein